MLAGLTVPLASADTVTITFLNPLAELEPHDNMPIAPRAPLRNKIATGGEINLLVLYYGKINNAEMGIALADLFREEIIRDNPSLAGKVTITVASGGTSLYSQIPTSAVDAPLIGTDNNSVHYWKNQGPIDPDTGYPSYELNFERYAQWASFDAVVMTAAD